MKTIILLTTMLLTSSLINAQTVKMKNSYSDAVVYVDGNTLKAKNTYGDALFYKDTLNIASFIK